MGWDKLVGSNGISIGIDNKFGKSASANVLYKKFGLTANTIIKAVKSLL
jgi:transketolase